MEGKQFSRRHALSWGTTFAAGVIASTLLSAAGQSVTDNSDKDDPIWKEIEEIIQAQGMFSNGVFQIEIDRDDINFVTLHGVPILPSFQINGTLFFEKLADGSVIMNADMALKPSEIDRFIDQLVAHEIVFQAEHQHFYDFDPLVWFIHYRKIGDPIQIAHGIKAALDVTSTPFPQTLPSNPTTPLPADAMGKILGAQPQIGSDGVVTYDLPRAEPLYLGGIRINPYLNTATNIVFEPLDGGKSAAAAPDFGMISTEINRVVAVMRGQGWDIGCLYNQETNEQPQLYFSHQFKTGDPIELAFEIRRGLNLMNLQFM